MTPSPSKLTSRQHPVVRLFREVAAARGDEGHVLLDGEHLIVDALKAGVPVLHAIAGATFLASSGNAGHSLLGRLGKAGAAVYEATDAVLDAASPVRTSSGLVAIARWSPARLTDVFVASGPALVIGLMGVQDPGNMGSAIRSANALGATGVIALDGSADPAGWKALRGAMGSTFRLPIARAPLAEALAAAAGHHVAVLATAARRGASPDRADLKRPALLLFGAEGSGLDLSALPQGTEAVTVPMQSGVESLNVAVTVALLLYEARRQRADAGARA